MYDFNNIFIISDIIRIIKNIFEDVNLIYPRLWLGNINISKDISFIKDNQIDVIVNCTPDIPFIELENENGIEKIRIPVEDSLLEKDIILMEEYMKSVIPQLIEHYKNNKKILIHCYAGKQRSAILMAALLFKLHQNDQNLNLIKTNEKTKEELAEYVFSIILANRPQAFTFGYRYNFIKSFNRYTCLSHEIYRSIE